MNLDRLINRYLDGRAEPEELAQLAELLKHDDDAAMRLAEHALLLQHIEDHYRLQAIKADLLQGGLENVFPKESDVAGTIKEAEPSQPLTAASDDKLHDQRLTPSQPPASEGPDDSWPSTSFAGRAARGVKVAARGTLDWRRHPLQFVALAASITLILWAGFSAFLLPGMINPPRHEFAGEPQQPDVAGGPQRPDVAGGPQRPDVAAGAIAWLVSDEGAAWEGFAPNGRGMHAGQPLILLAGLAEFQYATGAVVILEGPAKFTVGTNRLSSPEPRTSPPANSGLLTLGTLVARVEGNRAKGFTVEMPHARIVDLGTEFGAQVQQGGDAEVVVFSGAVDLISQPAGSGGQRIRLVRDQAASVEAKSGAIARSTKLDPQLVSAMRTRLQTGSIAAKTLAGITLDDTSAKLIGEWSTSTNFKPHIGSGYVYSGREGEKAKGDGKATATFRTKTPESGQYRLLMAYSAHETRAKNVPVTIISGSHKARFNVDQTEPLPAGQHFQFVGKVQLEGDVETVITISNTDTVGFVIVDALQLLPANK